MLFRSSANSFCVIESNNPLLVVEFGLGNGYDGIGDPFMMMIPPIEQYSNAYVFNVLPEFSSNYITIFVSPEHFEPEKIFVDDMNQEGANWTTIYCTDRTVCGYSAYASLEAGEHRLYHSGTSAMIGVVTYGFNTYNSYGYPGGLQLTPLQCRHVMCNAGSYCILTLCITISIAVATVSFSQEVYSVGENEQTLTVSVLRSGQIDSFVVVLVANHPYEGTATGRFCVCISLYDPTLSYVSLLASCLSSIPSLLPL